MSLKRRVSIGCLVVSAVVVIALLALSGRSKEWTGVSIAMAAQKKQEVLSSPLQAEVNELVRSMTYFQDHRTGICFSYFWKRWHHGGPSHATVDCEKIPAHMLIVSQ
mgnify:CR=1 FL=1